MAQGPVIIQSVVVTCVPTHGPTYIEVQTESPGIELPKGLPMTLSYEPADLQRLLMLKQGAKP